MSVKLFVELALRHAQELPRPVQCRRASLQCCCCCFHGGVLHLLRLFTCDARASASPVPIYRPSKLFSASFSVPVSFKHEADADAVCFAWPCFPPFCSESRARWSMSGATRNARPKTCTRPPPRLVLNEIGPNHQKPIHPMGRRRKSWFARFQWALE